MQRRASDGTRGRHKVGAYQCCDKIVARRGKININVPCSVKNGMVILTSQFVTSTMLIRNLLAQGLKVLVILVTCHVRAPSHQSCDLIRRTRRVACTTQ